MQKGKLIAIEGLEGAGKSTAIEFIKSYLSSKPIQVIYTREPGGTFLAEKIRTLLITSFKEESLCAESELLLMYATRMQHIEKLIKPALDSGKWVVSDRFNWSSLAYQGGGRKLGFDKVKQINDLLLGNFMADLTIYMDIDPKLGLARAKSRHVLDRIEQENIDFFNCAREVFLKLVTIYSDNSVLIDGAKPIKEVESKLVSLFKKML
ncbi:dTMP kinase [Fastidiosibacter lacustris]|uniref:dTMP kinase n=1 Tax=Fastidiosibacter lacustris TaxID=2056695 RepID=UPI000E345D12|nr:dTMP kinase [Fastidiosibacter lacustris]